MHNIKDIAKDPAKCNKLWASRFRKLDYTAEQLVDMDNNRKTLIQRIDANRTQLKAISKAIGASMGSANPEDVATQRNVATAFKELIHTDEAALRVVEEDLRKALLAMPNFPSTYASQTQNVVLAEQRSVIGKPKFDFTPKEHHILGWQLGLIDADAAGKISGSRFSVLRGPLARLERAIGQFMLDELQTFNFEEVAVPALVKESTLEGTGQLPKFEEDLFFVQHGDNRLGLIPTAEVPLTNLYRDQIIKESFWTQSGENKPILLSALTPCFRSEAGSSGRDVHGMIRQHQFNKVEMVALCAEKQASYVHDLMLESAESILNSLGLHFRTLSLCTSELGFSAATTYDIEVWLPGQDCYREISSISDCGTFQARRMNTRYRDTDGEVKFVNTLNGSALAVGRTLVAIMENYQRADGSIGIPTVLQPYMGGLEEIRV